MPEEALTVRDGQSGVFVIDEDEAKAVWLPVAPGIRDKGRVEVSGEGLFGRVVTLGQQLLDNGSPVTVSDEFGKSRTAVSGSGKGQ